MNNGNYTGTSYDAEFVREVQNMLRIVGRSIGDSSLIIPNTGTYDRTTADAVRAFQRRNSLDPSGEVDSETWRRLTTEYKEALRRSGETGAIRPYPRYDGYELMGGERSELVFITQLMLNSLGMYYDLPSVPPNGNFDSQTEAAIREFQRVNMLPVTGVVDRITWDRLAEEYNETVNDSQ